MRNTLIIAFLLLINVQADFIRDNNLEVVNDTTTCLMWQDNNDSKTVRKNWQDAIEYCENLNFSEYDDWRLPNFNELYSIRDKSRINSSIKDAFINVNSSFYWSSTTNVNYPDIAWYISFNAWYDQPPLKSSLKYVRCVRDGN